MTDPIEEAASALRAAYARERGGCSPRIPACMGMAARGQCTCDPLPSDKWKRRIDNLITTATDLRTSLAEAEAKLAAAEASIVRMKHEACAVLVWACDSRPDPESAERAVQALSEKLAAVTAAHEVDIGYLREAEDERDRLQDALEAVTGERDDENARCRRMIDAKNRWLRRAKAAESALAAVKAERDELHRERTEARTEIEALATEGMRLESALARAMEAMPTAEERAAVARLNMLSSAHPQEWSAALCWLARLDAFRASQRQTGGDDA